MGDVTEIDIELLEPLLREFVQLIGLPATLAIVERFGGVRLYVPANPTPAHPLAELIGYDKLVALGSRFGAQEHFAIPKALRALQALRDARIRAKRHTASIRQLALEFQLSERRIHQIVGDEAPVDQGDFFA